MKISSMIAQLEKIKEVYGDLEIVGGNLQDDTPPTSACVVNEDGMEVFPNNPNGVDIKADIEGAFIT